MNLSDLPVMGTPQINAARRRFLRLLDRTLPSGNQPPDSLFSAQLDQQDIEWAMRVTGYPLTLPSDPGGPTDLNHAFCDVPQSACSAMRAILRANGLQSDHDDPTRLATQLFRLCQRPRLSGLLSKNAPGYLLDDPALIKAAKRVTGYFAKS